ncbi:MAG: response regulator [Syntrophales bacterium]|nr:response regulator [Syntrophales bacterium]
MVPVILQTVPDDVSVYTRRILVVDDDDSTRELIVEELKQHGYRYICEARNGNEALKIIKEDQFDLVITDIVMPYIDGINLLQRLKEVSPSTSVIVITAKPATDIAVNALKLGAVDFLPKPFQLNELTYKVDVCLRSKCLDLESHSDTSGVFQSAEKKSFDYSIQSYIYESLENLEGNNEEIFSKMAELAIRVVDGDVCRIVIYDSQIGDFYTKVLRTTYGVVKEDIPPEALTPFLYQVFEKKEALLVNSFELPEISPSLIVVPLTIRGYVFGVLTVKRKPYMGSFGSKDLHYVTSLARRASLNIENRLLYESLYSNVLDTFRALISSIQLRDDYTEQHCMRVTKVSLETAKLLGLPEQDMETLKIAASLHDIGKIGIPDSILLKKGKLTEEEYSIIKTHSEIGEKMLASIALFEKERKIILHHHERWDGKGYPTNLCGEDIPLLSRIIAMADAYDAMTNNRPYRMAQDRGWAIKEIERNIGSQFDPQIFEYFKKAVASPE